MSNQIFIRLREHILNLVLRIPAEEVLNPVPFTGFLPDAVELATELKQATNQIQSEAIDPVSGLVDYDTIPTLQSFHHYRDSLIPRLQKVDLATLPNRSNRTAFWINLYNSLTLHAIIAFQIKKSITFGGVGNHIRFFRQAAYSIGGKRFSLEDIEHGILRANAGNPFQFSRNFADDDPRTTFMISPIDPRIHFALNCASISCPPINFYSPEKLEAELDLASASFISAETNLKGDRFLISSIFKWYQRDFGGKTQIADFLLRYLPEGKRKDWLRANRTNLKFDYIPYDWGLNKLN